MPSVQLAPLPGTTPVLVEPPLLQLASTAVGVPPGQVTVLMFAVLSWAIIPTVVPEGSLTTMIVALPVRPATNIE